MGRGGSTGIERRLCYLTCKHLILSLSPRSLSDYCLQYGDLLTVLKELAVEVGVTVRPDADVSTISTKPDPRPSVTLSTGEVLYCDVIVGADGFSGQCRRSLYGQVEQPVFTWRGLYRYFPIKPVLTQFSLMSRK